MFAETERLILRGFTINDAESLYNIIQDKSIKDYIPYIYSYSVEDLRLDILKYYSKCDFDNDFYLIIELKETKEIIGALIVTRSKNFCEYDVSMLIDCKHRRKGYMTEALKAFISKMKKGIILSFLVKSENIASIKTIEKIGATRITLNSKYIKKVVYLYHVK